MKSARQTFLGGMLAVAGAAIAPSRAQIQTTSSQRNQKMKRSLLHNGLSLLLATAALLGVVGSVAAADKKPNILILMTDDTGWSDFGCYGGGANLGHPTPNIDKVAKEGAVFTCWYGQASCTAGRASFMTGRIPIRSALSVVVVPGDENGLTKSHADDRRVLPKERLWHLFLGQVASW